MVIHNIESFLAYYERIRQRTHRVIARVPEKHWEWTYKEGKFTIGDLVRHIAAIERYLYAETVLGKPSCYKGCGTELADGKEESIAFFDRMHRESVEIFAQLTPEQLDQKCQTPMGTPITTWKWLRALVEHEIHHRGQIYLYLGMLGVETPPLYGLTSEEVIEKSQ